MSLQERDKLTMKSRGRSRGWLSAWGGRGVGERSCDGSAETARGGAARLKTKRHPGLMKYR